MKCAQHSLYSYLIKSLLLVGIELIAESAIISAIKWIKQYLGKQVGEFILRDVSRLREENLIADQFLASFRQHNLD